MVLTEQMIADALAKAVEHARNGRLVEAETICRKFLTLSPDHTPSLRLLGTIALKTGRYVDAAAHLARAVSLHPPDADLHHLLGVAQLRMGQPKPAIDSLQAALQLGGSAADVQCALGIAWTATDQPDAAIAAFRAALASNPDLAEAHFNLAALLAGRRQWAEAIDHYRETVRCDPGSAHAHFNLGSVLAGQGRWAEAIRHYREAVRLRPGNAEAHGSLGLALAAEGMAEEAAAEYREALRIDPKHPDAPRNLALALIDAGRREEAIGELRAILRREPDSAEAHFHLASALLGLGHFEEGWREYEWRWRYEAGKPYVRPFRQPLWTGEDVAGQVLLLHAEQGFGDTLQFCRYAPLAAARCAKVYLEVQPELMRLLDFSLASDRLRVVARVPGFPGVGGLPAADRHCPLLGLPRAFGTTLASIPAAIPYLRADPTEVALWSRRLAALKRPLVGLAWTGQSIHAQDRRRSIPLDRLAPLAEVPGVSFVSLQKEKAVAHAGTSGMVLHEFTADLPDFAATAALVAALDLVISVDTAVAHLAGALGKPVWLLNRRLTDWRWLVAREDSPWYPTMRLFRQPSHGDWDSVIARVADALRRAG